MDPSIRGKRNFLQQDTCVKCCKKGWIKVMNERYLVIDTLLSSMGSGWAKEVCTKHKIPSGFLYKVKHFSLVIRAQSRFKSCIARLWGIRFIRTNSD